MVSIRLEGAGQKAKAMNLNESIREWVNLKSPEFSSLSPVTVVTMGEHEDLTPPFLAIYETGATTTEQGGVILHGVSAYEIAVELHTVPVDEDQSGTPTDTERTMRRDLFNILGNRDCISYLHGRNGFAVFDIRAGNPTTEPNEGRRITRFGLTVIAAPIA